MLCAVGVCWCQCGCVGVLCASAFKPSVRPRALHRVQAGLKVPDMDRFHYFDFRAIFACLQNFYAKGVINVTFGEVLVCVQDMLA